VEVESAATLICDPADGEAARAYGFAAPIAVPHFLQNSAPGLTDPSHAGHTNSSFAPHLSQNDAPDGLSLLHFAQSIFLRAKFVEEGLGVDKVGGVEALGEPVVDVGEHRAGFVSTTLRREQACETHRSPQLP